MLVLKVLFNLAPNTSYKSVKFSKTLPEKGFEFFLSKGDGIAIFNLNLMRLLVEINFILEE